MVLDRFWVGAACLSVFEGAFTCEAIRAGILSVARGQWEESDSIGLDRVQGSSPRGSERNSRPSRTPLRTSHSRRARGLRG